MIWLDYAIEQSGVDFKVKGAWEGEVMGVKQDGTPNDHLLYKPGDVFRVDDNGWFRKSQDKNGAIKG